MNANNWNPSDTRRWDHPSPIYGRSTYDRKDKPKKKSSKRKLLKNLYRDTKLNLSFKDWLKHYAQD